MGRAAAKDGATKINARGYRRVRVFGVWQFEQRVVAELVLGRRLVPGEKVFFRDGDKLNTAPENLKVGFSAVTAADLVPIAASDPRTRYAGESTGRTVCDCALRLAKRRRDARYRANKRAKASA